MKKNNWRNHILEHEALTSIENKRLSSLTKGIIEG